MSGPLDGYRVIDLTTMVSGPFATMILGDQGAEVVKIEPLREGEHMRKGSNRSGGFAANFLNNNRNKRSIAVNLKDPKGCAIVTSLAEKADIFIQNFRPGVIERLGLGEKDVRKVKKDIIYVSITGFGETGPYAQKRVYDPIIQAASGLASIQGGSDKSRPRLVRTILPDKLTGITAAQAVTAALLTRERTGKGQHVRLSMLDTVLSFLWASDMGGQTFFDQSNNSQSPASFIDLIYETKDGYMSVAVMSDSEWVGLTSALDRKQWLQDKRFTTPALRDDHINERLELTQEVLLTETTEYWMERLEAEGVPCAPVLTRNALLEHPQIAASGSIIEYEHPVAGKLRQARPAARFEGTPSSIRFGAPLLGEHTEELLMEAGVTPEKIIELRQAGIVA